jgi:diacylglycerol kinase family enzyme
MYVGVVLNPRARKNRGVAADRFARITQILGARGEVVRTESVEALRPAVERLLPRVTHLVSDGGDGALHWLLNEVRRVAGGDAGSEAWPTFVPTNGGTIDFVAHKAGVRGSSEAILAALADAAEAERPPPEVALDSLRISGERSDGSTFERLGFALAAGGVGQRFFDKYYEDPSPSPRTIMRVIGRTVSDFARDRLGARSDEHESFAAHLFRPTEARVTIDGEELPTTRHDGLHAGAFDVNLGGVIRLFPLAAEPGVIQLQAGEISPLRVIASLPSLVRGGPIRAPKLRDTAGAQMRIEALGEERLSPIVDGERFEGLRTLEVCAGPRVRIARVRAR